MVCTSNLFTIIIIIYVVGVVGLFPKALAEAYLALLKEINQLLTICSKKTYEFDGDESDDYARKRYKQGRVYVDI